MDTFQPLKMFWMFLLTPWWPLFVFCFYPHPTFIHPCKYLLFCLWFQLFPCTDRLKSWEALELTHRVNALQQVFIFSVVEGMLRTSCPSTHKRWHNSCTHSHPLHRCLVDRDLWSLATAGRGGWAMMGPPAAATALRQLPNLIQTSGAQAVARMSWCILGLNAERSRME